eukprot:3279237-Rhodomonas_salina.2
MQLRGNTRCQHRKYHCTESTVPCASLLAGASEIHCAKSRPKRTSGKGRRGSRRGLATMLVCYV